MCFKRANFISFHCPGETWNDLFLVNSYVPSLLTLLCAPQCLCTSNWNGICFRSNDKHAKFKCAIEFIVPH